MSTESRRKNSSVVHLLQKQPDAFSFFQAVRLLERSAHFNKASEEVAYQPVARYSPPEKELIRFSAPATLKFSSSEILSVHQVLTKNHLLNKQWKMQIPFMSLTQATGVLPFHYTELLLSRIKMKDYSLADFLDLFNHRLISLFYQSSNKYFLPVEYERKKLFATRDKKTDQFTQTLLSMIGLGTQHLNYKLLIPDEALLFYSGSLTHKMPNASSLKHMLQDYFRFPVTIKEFVGQWQPLIDDIRTQLGNRYNIKGQNASLGASAILGSKSWFAQGKCQIIIGPLNEQQFAQVSPGTQTLKAFKQFVRFYLGFEYDFDLIVRTYRKVLPQQIILGGQQSAIIGWNTWMNTPKSLMTKPDEILDIPIGQNQMN